MAKPPLNGPAALHGGNLYGRLFYATNQEKREERNGAFLYRGAGEGRRALLFAQVVTGLYHFRQVFQENVNQAGVEIFPLALIQFRSRVFGGPRPLVRPFGGQRVEGVAKGAYPAFHGYLLSFGSCRVPSAVPVLVMVEYRGNELLEAPGFLEDLPPDLREIGRASCRERV